MTTNNTIKQDEKPVSKDPGHLWCCEKCDAEYTFEEYIDLYIWCRSCLNNKNYFYTKKIKTDYKLNIVIKKLVK